MYFRNHPFYITNSSDGGYEEKTQEERYNEVIYAGAVESQNTGQFSPIASKCFFWRLIN